jgi:hypothetical protein
LAIDADEEETAFVNPLGHIMRETISARNLHEGTMTRPAEMTSAKLVSRFGRKVGRVAPRAPAWRPDGRTMLREAYGC